MITTTKKCSSNDFLFSKLFILKRINFHILLPFAFVRSLFFFLLSFTFNVQNSFLITLKRERKYNNNHTRNREKHVKKRERES